MSVGAGWVAWRDRARRERDLLPDARYSGPGRPHFWPGGLARIAARDHCLGECRPRVVAGRQSDWPDDRVERYAPGNRDRRGGRRPRRRRTGSSWRWPRSRSRSGGLFRRDATAPERVDVGRPHSGRFDGGSPSASPGRAGGRSSAARHAGSLAARLVGRDGRRATVHVIPERRVRRRRADWRRSAFTACSPARSRSAQRRSECE
jgi:hypothetical protein